MMRNFYTFLFLLTLFAGPLQAQLSILFVDDSADNYANSMFLTDAFDAEGISYTLFDAQTEGFSPELATLEQYDLVVWHTSSWGDGLYLWYGNDEINTDLAAYLSGGGNLWLIGHDFFFDRYGSPPVDFAAGDFEYDYLGVESFAVESYTDDGETGVPFVTPATDQPIPGLNDVNFIFSTLWYADGVTPRTETVPIYEFAGSGYALEGEVCGTWYDDGTSIALTYYFDLSLASTSEVAQTNIAAVIDFFSSQITTGTAEQLSLNDLSISPVPASDVADISFNLAETQDLSITVFDLTGKAVAVLADQQRFDAGQQQLTWSIPTELSSGLYFVQFRSQTASHSERIEVIR
ncbi:MAG: T9SS type A sorting domain-containing protein [Bacteroidetes bacterium]|nr:T9SS type A sorting domain-containing protein [Bacteroidota bacterium]